MIKNKKNVDFRVAVCCMTCKFAVFSKGTVLNMGCSAIDGFAFEKAIINGKEFVSVTRYNVCNEYKPTKAFKDRIKRN